MKNKVRKLIESIRKRKIKELWGEFSWGYGFRNITKEFKDRY